ncbi:MULTISPECIES: hypothetical protein [Bacteria]|uniref:hypothetical protein n=1 Tax=Bacteria TaxID=2 RepID=UPI000BE5B2A9|nr:MULTISPECIES: hypothetical protein [Bacteria]MCP8850160.1 hypothetical protein [Latilactobacillus curvatus]WIL38671.1 hypothetical protein QN089_15485 [Kurthia sp. YJT4]
MNRKGWICLGVAGCLAVWSISLFGSGYGYYNSQVGQWLYVKFMGDIVKVTTTEELNKYAYLYMGLSIIPAFLALYLYRKFLKIVPVKQEV